MNNFDFDFIVKKVNRVVERPDATNWSVSNIYFENNYVMVISLSGEAHYTINNTQEFITKANDICIFPPGNHRSGKANPQKPWQFISVNFDLEFLNDSQNLFNEMFFLTTEANDKFRHKFTELASVWTGRGLLYKNESRAIVNEIICQLIADRIRLQTHQIPHQRKMDKALKYIQQNFTGKISIENLADESNLSVSHFRKLFLQCYGMSPKQYITYLRINKAKDLLSSGEFNVTESALLSGFDDVFYFSSLIKRKTGLTPSQIMIQKNNPINIEP